MASDLYWQRYPWLWLIVGVERFVPDVLLATFGIGAFLSWDWLGANLDKLFTDSSPAASETLKRFSIHLGVLIALAVWTAVGWRMPPSPIWVAWIWFRLALEMATLATWVAVALPPAFFVRWLNAAPRAFIIAAAAGVTARIVNHFMAIPWELTRRATFAMVFAILRLLGQTVVIDPAHSQIGTRSFNVEIAPRCSGLDGIAITSVLVGIYLWIYRRELRFPAALALLPAGVLLAWILNAIRIVALIFIGEWSPTMAVDGFHSVAGWLSLSIVASVVLVASFRIPVFRSVPVARGTRTSMATLYLLPMLAIIATGMLTKALHPGFDLLYPARVLVAGAIFWYYRREMIAIIASPMMFALVMGAIVFVIWIVLAPARDAAFNASFATGLDSLSPVARACWLMFRVTGAIVTVPIAEELAFRGYLMRKLVATDFDSVAFSTFTWISFLGSSILFGLMHNQWVAGIAAGMIFAFAAYRRGSLSDAIFAHAVANAMLSAYVLMTNSWWLWS